MHLEECVPNVTLRDVARAVGVHPSTVSRALDPQRSWTINEQTRLKIVQTAQALGYKPDTLASGLRRGRSETIGVVVPDLANPFYAPMIRGIENALEGRGLMALIAETQEDQQRMSKVFEHLARRRVDGIITASARKGDETLLRKFSQDVPIVLAGRSLERSGLPTITHDDVMGGRLLAEHLLALGHTRIAQLSGPADISSFVGRSHGFAMALTAAGIEVINLPERAVNPTIAEGKRLMQYLLATIAPRPTAVFAPNDLMALGALEALHEAELRCPDDLSLVGYNDSPQAPYTAPPLTTVRVPGYELGRLAAELVVTLAEEPGRVLPNISLPPVLVVRRSSALHY